MTTTMINDDVMGSAEQAAVDQLVDAGLLDEVMSRVGAGDLRLTGEGGFLPGLIKAVLERGRAHRVLRRAHWVPRGDRGDRVILGVIGFSGVVVSAIVAVAIINVADFLII